MQFKRPVLYNFLSIETHDGLSIRALVALASKNTDNLSSPLTQITGPSKPWQAIGLLSGTIFKIKIVGLNHEHQEVFNRIYESDDHGNFQIKMTKLGHLSRVTRLQIYEVGTVAGIEFLLGNFIPIPLFDPKKIIISDFDKTLVDTRYSTTKELYLSLTRPLEHFPQINQSIQILKSYIDSQFQPFILTASPHFYENAIRDWLYKKSIYTAGIFLKDYRILLSPWEGDLTAKDLKTQGFYKLNQLITILLMTNIPDELVLMGDGAESDTIIYLTLTSLILDNQDPWGLWKKIKHLEAFKFNNPQNSKFLTKTYQLKTLINQAPQKAKNIKIKIFIRCFPKQKKPQVTLAPLKDHLDLVEFYEA
jgi:hypothetical protein